MLVGTILCKWYNYVGKSFLKSFSENKNPYWTKFVAFFQFTTWKNTLIDENVDSICFIRLIYFSSPTA